MYLDELNCACPQWDSESGTGTCAATDTIKRLEMIGVAKEVNGKRLPYERVLSG
jgi:hypothetical protein